MARILGTPSNRTELRKPVVLVGMMGAGKTAVGAELARKLGVAFIDSDDEIERAAAMSISDIFARDGEDFFRRRESEVLERLLQGPAKVIATGGGAFMAERNRQAIGVHGVSVFLDCPLETLWTRVKGRTTRPLLQTQDPKTTLAHLWAKRAPIYALADLTVHSGDEDSPSGIVERMVTVLTDQGVLARSEV